jgi:hypothetical protein
MAEFPMQRNVAALAVPLHLGEAQSFLQAIPTLPKTGKSPVSNKTPRQSRVQQAVHPTLPI